MNENLMTSEEFDESILTNKDLNNALNQKSNQMILMLCGIRK